MSHDFPPDRPSEPLFLVPWQVPAFAGVFIALFALYAYAPSGWHAWADARLPLVPARFLTDDANTLLLAFSNLITYAGMHGGWAHVIMNCALLMAAAGPVQRNCGTLGMVALFLASSIGGGLAHLAVHWGEAVPVVGASAGAGGLIGAALRYRARRLSQGEIVAPMSRPPVITFTWLWCGLNAAFFLWDQLGGGFVTGIAAVAHIGGYLTGLLLAGVFVRGARPRPWPPQG